MEIYKGKIKLVLVTYCKSLHFLFFLIPKIDQTICYWAESLSYHHNQILLRVGPDIRSDRIFSLTLLKLSGRISDNLFFYIKQIEIIRPNPNDITNPPYLPLCFINNSFVAICEFANACAYPFKNDFEPNNFLQPVTWYLTWRKATL